MTDKPELRGNVPLQFLERLDAVARSDGLSRMELVIAVMGPELDRRIHSATVLLRCIGINPLAPDRGRDQSDRGVGQSSSAKYGNEQTNGEEV